MSEPKILTDINDRFPLGSRGDTFHAILRVSETGRKKPAAPKRTICAPWGEGARCTEVRNRSAGIESPHWGMDPGT